MTRTPRMWWNGLERKRVASRRSRTEIPNHVDMRAPHAVERTRAEAGGAARVVSCYATLRCAQLAEIAAPKSGTVAAKPDAWPNRDASFPAPGI